ncbi:RDD family protein [Planococcus plakortidis]|uniref:RDD family protein n=1 Tax=Planococcus plakortidis TaxID=1038856 RepID=A0A1C7E5T5_9BACL|nr:RDD family protein [Planococcus plakortidis]ANU19089.1 RDD family protein [Planococcus plakortidis]
MTDHVNTDAAERAAATPPSQPENDLVLFYERKPAGFWMRFWAYLVDILLISAVSSILIRPLFALFGWEATESVWYAPYAILTAVVFYGYFVLMTKFFAQTVGKMIFGLRVVSLKTDRLSWATLLFREWIGRFISVTILPLYWIVGFTPLKQGVHDFIADTTVVHEEAYRKQQMARKRLEGSRLQESEGI